MEVYQFDIGTVWYALEWYGIVQYGTIPTSAANLIRYYSILAKQSWDNLEKENNEVFEWIKYNYSIQHHARNWELFRACLVLLLFVFLFLKKLVTYQMEIDLKDSICTKLLVFLVSLFIPFLKQ